ncbi:YheC/YheD family protein [Paenibacillus filicis]|uniref:YheC/YheD family protein n=1 Tax=Paenibacillus gyeongsangnamensis TaxID=3388067 RepID=A0ABT4Q987_9BACL|nr:YheC/YheD family protein [Paenibacillus filicis]MCZ8513443.1 YheC/YheD family protein [Paenibacillus filicis]
MGRQLGILAMYWAEGKLEELSFFRRLCIYGRKLGLEVLVFTPDDVDDSKESIHALTYSHSDGKWIRKWSALPPLIYDRCRYRGADNYRKITSFRNKYKNVDYLSRPLANKWTVYEVLSEQEGIRPYLPFTVRYQSLKDLSQMLKKYPIVYMKPKNGTGGRGIVRLQRLGSSQIVWMEGRDPSRRILPQQKIHIRQIPAKLSSWKLEELYLVQQGIPLALKDGRVHDFRMLVQKDGSGEWQVTGCAGRIGPRLSVTSNLHGGGTAVPMEILLRNRFGTEEKVREIKKDAYALGLRVVKQLESKFGALCEAGIDLAIDPKGDIWLLEVNPKPSREVFRRIGETANYRKAHLRPLEYALWKLKRRKPEEETSGMDE